jgi:hypothetical protein
MTIVHAPKAAPLTPVAVHMARFNRGSPASFVTLPSVAASWQWKRTPSIGQAGWRVSPSPGSRRCCTSRAHFTEAMFCPRGACAGPEPITPLPFSFDVELKFDPSGPNHESFTTRDSSGWARLRPVQIGVDVPRADRPAQVARLNCARGRQVRRADWGKGWHPAWPPAGMPTKQQVSVALRFRGRWASRACRGSQR